MEIYQLKVFLEVARCLSFTEAAEALNLTQPAVSAKIKSLESELKTSLFERQGRQILLTEVGQYLVKEGKELVELEAKISRNVEKIKQHGFDCLTIGSTLSLAQSWLPQLIYQYRQRYACIQTKLEVFSNSKSLYQAVVQGNVDLGFSAVRFAHCPDLEQRKIAPIQYSLVVAPSRPLAAQTWLSLADIRQEPLVLLSDRFASRQIFESRLSELGLKPADFPLLESVDTIGLMRTYLTKGNYIGFASKLEFQEELESRILTAITLHEFALEADIHVLIPKKVAGAKGNRGKHSDKNPVKKFLALFPATASQNKIDPPPKMRSPAFSINPPPSRKEKISINLGIQNRTIPTITAGLILQRLKLLEHFLPRTERYTQVKFDIHWHNFHSGTPIVEGLHAKRLDIGILGDYPLLQSATQKDSEPFEPTLLVSFVSINPDGNGNAVIVPQTSKLEAVEDLHEKTVALPFGSSAHGMLLRALSNLNLLSKVQLFPLKNSLIQAPIHPELVDGYAYFSPFHQLARDRGNFKYLFNGNISGLPGFYGVVVSQSFADRYPEIVVSYLKALVTAQRWLANTPSAFSLISQWTKIKPQILASTISPTLQAAASSLFVTDYNIRPDWLASHINQLRDIPTAQHVGKIELERWIQPDFLQTAVKN